MLVRGIVESKGARRLGAGRAARAVHPPSQRRMEPQRPLRRAGTLPGHELPGRGGGGGACPPHCGKQAPPAGGSRPVAQWHGPSPSRVAAAPARGGASVAQARPSVPAALQSFFTLHCNKHRYSTSQGPLHEHGMSAHSQRGMLRPAVAGDSAICVGFASACASRTARLMPTGLLGLLHAAITLTIVARMPGIAAGQFGDRNRAQKYSQLAALRDISRKAAKPSSHRALDMCSPSLAQ